eukprot:scaffold44844_cov21-Prasinocladus_malaysianus.AAC.1
MECTGINQAVYYVIISRHRDNVRKLLPIADFNTSKKLSNAIKSVVCKILTAQKSYANICISCLHHITFSFVNASAELARGWLNGDPRKDKVQDSAETDPDMVALGGSGREPARLTGRPPVLVQRKCYGHHEVALIDFGRWERHRRPALAPEKAEPERERIKRNREDSEVDNDDVVRRPPQAGRLPARYRQKGEKKRYGKGRGCGGANL